MDGQTNRQTNMDRHGYRQTNYVIVICYVDREMDGQTDRQTNEWTDKLCCRYLIIIQAERRKYRQIDRQTDRQTWIQTDKLCCMYLLFRQRDGWTDTD